MPETRSLGNCCQRQVGFIEKFDGSVEADSQNFVMDGSFEDLSEFSVQRAARKRHVFGDVLNADRLRCVVSNETHRGRDIPVLNRQHVCGPSYDDFRRFKQQFLFVARSARHQFVEQLGCLVADLIVNRDDAGKHRIAEFARSFVVVDTENGDFFRH